MLHLNDNRFGFPREFLEKARDLLETCGIYPDEWRNDLQNELARRLNVPRNHLLIVNGITEALEILARHNRGKTVGTLHPSHPPFQKMLSLHDASIFHWNVLEKGSFFLDKIDYPREKHVSTVFIDTPNDPLGMDIPLSLIKEFLDSHEDLVVIDEAGWGFSEQDCSELIKTYENVVILRTFSKVFGLAGVRVGYILGNPEILEHVFIRHRTRDGASLFSQQLALLALETKVDQYLKQKVSETRKLFQTLLDETEIPYFPSTTNYVLLEAPSKKALDEIEQELSRHRVFIQPFYELSGKSYLRVTLAPMEALEYVVEAFEVYRHD